MTKLRKRTKRFQKVDVQSLALTIEAGPQTGKEHWTPGAKIEVLERPSGRKTPLAVTMALMAQEGNKYFRANEKQSHKVNTRILGKDYKRMRMDSFYLLLGIVLAEVTGTIMGSILMDWNY